MPEVTYPFDTTGLASTNLIVDEVHTLTEINSNTYRIFIPVFAPFYLDNISLSHVDNLGVTTPLVENVDYTLCLPFIGGTRSIGKMMYGGITVNTELINGVVKITYQTLGGPWTADASVVLETLAQLIYNPRVTIWDLVTSKPEEFPPIYHDQSLDYVYGHQDLITSINTVADTIAAQPSSSTALINHMINDTNPHSVTKAQVGLSNVANLPLASDLEVSELAEVDKYVTLKQIVTTGILSLDSSVVTAHMANTSNPHGVTKTQVGLSNVVNYPVADNTEITAQTSVDKYVLLSQMLTLIDTKIAAAALTQDSYLTPELMYLINK